LGLILIESFKGKNMKKTIFSTTMFVLFSSTVLFAGADAGIEQEVHSGEQVQLSGEGSTLEKDGKFVRFNWRQTDGESYVSLSSTKTLQTTFTAPEVTESTVLTFRLTTKERYSKKHIFRSRDFVNVIVFPKEVVGITEPSLPVENNPKQINFKEFSYLPVSSPLTGRIWLDRNLGATKKCDTPTDVLCFGDLYQWGRGADGHQLVTSKSQEGTIAIDDVSNRFMTGTPEDGSYVSYDDWTFGSRDILVANWSSTDGSSICPVGFRVPTLVEIEDEKLNLLDDVGIANNFLKIPFAGYRLPKLADVIVGKNQEFTLWSTTTVFAGRQDLGYGKRVTKNYPLYVNGETITPDSETSVSIGNLLRSGGEGFSVRCIKD